jgi:hypothetical protein
MTERLRSSFRLVTGIHPYSGHLEEASHGRNHIHTPYPDPAYAVSGSKADIMSYHVLPDPFSGGQHQVVRLHIYTIAGQLVETLADSVQGRGYYRVQGMPVACHPERICKVFRPKEKLMPKGWSRSDRVNRLAFFL